MARLEPLDLPSIHGKTGIGWHRGMKRGQSEISCLLAVDKPVGCTSHDVVSIARKAVGERRVGHAGTLDPFASGVLVLMVGPAARLDNFLMSEYKTYDATIVFGASSTTDDCTGEAMASKDPSSHVLDREYAEGVLRDFLGESMQMPPVYSAIKVNGKKSYDAARKGNIVKLQPRPIEVMQADLLEMGVADGAFSQATYDVAKRSIRNGSPDDALFASYLSAPFWKVRFRVSKGTYIRSLARDIGKKADCPAHLCALRRTASGNVDICDCVTPDALEHDWKRACIDPVYALGFKLIFANDKQAKDVRCGRTFRPYSDQVLKIAHGRSSCECLPPFVQCQGALASGEKVSIVADNALQAIYEYDEGKQALKPACVFNIGVSRGYIA